MVGLLQVGFTSCAAQIPRNAQERQFENLSKYELCHSGLTVLGMDSSVTAKDPAQVMPARGFMN
jgi:hypothetical protein